MAVQSVDRALSLLEVVAEEPRGLVEVASAASLPLSTASRLLATLEARGAVQRSGDGRYEIGSLLRALAASERDTTSVQTAAAPEVAWLADTVGEAACLSIPIGDETLTVMQIDSPKPVQAQDWTGHRWSLPGGGSGAVMMATWPNGRVEDLLRGLADDKRIEARREVAAARASGISWSRGVHVDGLTSVAAAIVDPAGEAVAALVGYGPSYRFPPDGGLAAVEAAVRSAAERASNRLAER